MALSEQDILNDVTGSNASLGAKLSGSGLPALPKLDITTYGTNAQGVPQSSGSNWFDNLLGLDATANPGDGSVLSFLGLNPITNAQQTPDQQGQPSSFGAALSFLTDLPRVAVTAVGLILIIAGIFALVQKPISVVINTATKAIT